MSSTAPFREFTVAAEGLFFGSSVRGLCRVPPCRSPRLQELPRQLIGIDYRSSSIQVWHHPSLGLHAGQGQPGRELSPTRELSPVKQMSLYAIKGRDVGSSTRTARRIGNEINVSGELFSLPPARAKWGCHRSCNSLRRFDGLPGLRGPALSCAVVHHGRWRMNRPDDGGRV